MGVCFEAGRPAARLMPRRAAAATLVPPAPATAPTSKILFRCGQKYATYGIDQKWTDRPADPLPRAGTAGLPPVVRPVKSSSSPSLSS